MKNYLGGRKNLCQFDIHRKKVYNYIHPLKERAAPYWLRIRFIMKAPLKEHSPEGTPQNKLLYRKTINYTFDKKNKLFKVPMIIRIKISK